MVGVGGSDLLLVQISICSQICATCTISSVLTITKQLEPVARLCADVRPAVARVDG